MKTAATAVRDSAQDVECVAAMPNLERPMFVQQAAIRIVPAEPPRSRETPSWLWAVAISIGLHIAVAVALTIHWSFARSEADPPPAAMVVQLAVMPSSPPVPASEIPPGPRQVESAPRPKVRPTLQFDPPPRVDPDIKPLFAVPLEVKTPPLRTLPQADEAHTTAAPPSTEAPKDKSNKAPVEGAHVALPSDAEQAWEGRILARLERNKRYPAQAQSAGQQDVVTVRMVLDRMGRVVESQIVNSRGYNLLDQEVMQLVRRSSPFSAPPESVTGDRIDLVVPVEFFLKKHR